ncbi:MAG: CDP-alcohol phosphatidyltransferase family protein [Deltaproteobacteria bacterium]|nr:CDP-alcohol phosphatidyltransferase family protein [Deltaproteobacteria bacterium]
MSRALIWIDEESRAAAAGCSYLGLTVVERLLRNLRARGVEEAVIGGQQTVSLPRDLEGFARYEGAGLSELLGGLSSKGEPVLVLAGDVVCHPQLMARLLERLEAGEPFVVAAEDEGYPIVVATSEAWRDITSAEHAPESLAELMVHFRDAPREELVSQYSAEEHGALFSVPMAGDGPIRARKLLLKLNWRPHDGIVAGAINKHISVPISAAIVGTGITPNGLTAAAFVIALVGIYLTSLGTYTMFLLGAALVQVQSILDGCDGEIARLRYLSSRFGAWFDTVVDDVIGVLWVVAASVGSYHMTGESAWLWVAAIGGGVYFLSLAFVYTTLIIARAEGHQDFVWFFEVGSVPKQDAPDRRKISTWLKYAMRRDFYVLFFFLLSIVGLLPVVAGLSATAALGWFSVTVVQAAKCGLSVNCGSRSG